MQRASRKGSVRKTRSTKTGAFRSKLEGTVAKQLDLYRVAYEYEPKDGKISYRIPSTEHTYNPDFVITKKDGSKMNIEAKGIWDYDDRYKHLLIRQQHPEKDIRFVFLRSQTKIRKGSKTTYADVCNGKSRGIFKGHTWLYSDGGKIPTNWFKE